MNFRLRRIVTVNSAVIALAGLTACGESSIPTAPPPPPPPPRIYSISGTIAGLGRGERIELHDNATDNLSIHANGAFVFPTKIAPGGAYAVTVSAPNGQTCSVIGGVGTASANVTGVTVTCVPATSGTLTVSGSVSGLAGQGLVLRLFFRSTVPYSSKTIPIHDIAISGNGKFHFAFNPRSDLDYGVTVAQQPHSPAQRCVVRSGYASFSVVTNVSDVSVVCGEFLYVANASKNTISAFSVDPATGALTLAGTPVATGWSPHAIVGSSDRRGLYVGNSGSNDVSEFAIDPSSGILTPVSGSPVAAGMHPESLLLFESNYLSFESTLVVANVGSNNLSVYEIDHATKVLAPHGTYATGANPTAMRSNAGFNSVLVVAGSDSMSVFGIGSALEAAPTAPYPSGGSVTSLAFGASNDGVSEFVYAANATGSAATISGFRFNVLSYYAPGAWTGINGFPYALPECTSIVTDQSGTYLYASAGKMLFGFSIDSQSGALSSLPAFPIALGTIASAVTIDPTNQFLYLRNGSAGKVTGFVLNHATGALIAMPGSPFTVGTSADFFGVF